MEDAKGIQIRPSDVEKVGFTMDMDIKRILHIITSECKNGCIDYASTIKYFYSHHKNADLRLVGLIATSIDFDGLRCVERELFDATIQPTDTTPASSWRDYQLEHQ